MARQELQIQKEKEDGRRERWLLPSSTIREAEDGSVRLELEMPGVSTETLEIEVENRELRITGRRESAPPQGEYLLRERSEGSYFRAFTLDDTIDPEQIDAAMAAGVLTVTLHRKESEKPRKIAIKTG
jgi:HSP20 family protein